MEWEDGELAFAVSLAIVKWDVQEKFTSDGDHVRAELGSWARFYFMCVCRAQIPWTISSSG